MGNYPDLFEGVTHIYDINGDAIDVWAGLASTVTGADLTTDSRGVTNNAYDFVSANSDKIALGDIAETKTVVLRVNLDSTTENIFEGSANDKELYASGGTLTYPDRDNVYVDGVDTDTITTGRHTIVLTSTTDVDCTAFQLGIINATYGDFTIEWMATFDTDKSTYALAFHNLLTQQYIPPFDKTLPVWWKEDCKLLLNGTYSGSTVYDQSGNGNNGTSTGITYGRIGRHKYFSFAGSTNKITTTYQGRPKFMCAWVYWDSTSTKNSCMIVGKRGDSSNNDYIFYLSNYLSAFNVVYASYNSSNSSAVNLGSSDTIPKNTRTFVAVRDNLSTQTIYVNGVPSGTASVSYTPSTKAINTYIGGEPRFDGTTNMEGDIAYPYLSEDDVSDVQVLEMYYRTFIPNV